jgi:hypothetical protein
MNWLHPALIKQAASFAPVVELAGGLIIGSPRVSIAEVRCEEFPETLGRLCVREKEGRKPHVEIRDVSGTRKGDQVITVPDIRDAHF